MEGSLVPFGTSLRIEMSGKEVCASEGGKDLMTINQFEKNPGLGITQKIVNIAVLLTVGLPVPVIPGNVLVGFAPLTGMVFFPDLVGGTTSGTLIWIARVGIIREFSPLSHTTPTIEPPGMVRIPLKGNPPSGLQRMKGARYSIGITSGGLGVEEVPVVSV
jgi:hypothetical protein